MGSQRSPKPKILKKDRRTVQVAEYFRKNYEFTERSDRIEWIKSTFSVGDSSAKNYHSWALQFLKTEAQLAGKSDFLDNRNTLKKKEELNRELKIADDEYENGEIIPHKEIIRNYDFLNTVTKGINSRQYGDKVRNAAAKELVQMYKDFSGIIKVSNKKSLEKRLYTMLKKVADSLNVPSTHADLQPDVDRLKQFPELWQPFDEAFEFDESINEALKVFVDNRQGSGQMHDRVTSVSMMNRVLAKPEFQILRTDENDICVAVADRMRAVFGLGKYRTEELKPVVNPFLIGSYWKKFQKDWIEDNAIQKISEKSRRTGYTFGSSFEWTLDALEFAGDDSIWISKTEKLAKQFSKKYLSHWANVVNILAEQKLIDKRKITAGSADYPNGHQILLLSSNPDSAAGFGGKVGIDEYALHSQQEQLYDVSQPATMYGDRIQIISTHRGRGQYYHFVQDAKKGIGQWSYHRCTIKDAIRQGIVQAVNNERARKGHPPLTDEAFYKQIRGMSRSEAAFLQEWMCEPADEIDAILNYDLIRTCVAPENTIINKDGTGRQYFGYDFGLTVNPSVMLRLEETKDEKLIMREFKFIRENRFANQRTLACRMMDKCHRGSMDAGAQGSQMAQELEETYKNKFEGVMLTGATMRAEIANLVWRFFDEGRIVIPDDDEVIEHLFAMKKEEKEGRQPRIYSEGTSNKDDHADFFWALGLALYAHGGYTSSEVIIRRLPPSMRRSRDVFTNGFY